MKETRRPFSLPMTRDVTPFQSCGLNRDYSDSDDNAVALEYAGLSHVGKPSAYLLFYLDEIECTWRIIWSI